MMVGTQVETFWLAYALHIYINITKSLRNFSIVARSNDLNQYGLSLTRRDVG
jgi:hypothetical protein